MTAVQITCDNCGAKYKLPESFAGTQAKCQKCGSAIDVARQRASPDEAATGARPAAAARPAIDRSKLAPPKHHERSTPTGRGSKSAKPGSTSAKPGSTSAKPGSTSAKPGSTSAKPGSSRDRRERTQKKSNATPLLLGGVGLAAVIVVVVLMMKGG